MLHCTTLHEEGMCGNCTASPGMVYPVKCEPEHVNDVRVRLRCVQRARKLEDSVSGAHRK